MSVPRATLIPIAMTPALDALHDGRRTMSAHVRTAWMDRRG